MLLKSRQAFLYFENLGVEVTVPLKLNISLMFVSVEFDGIDNFLAHLKCDCFLSY